MRDDFGALMVAHLIVSGRARTIEADPTFWSYLEEQFSLEPFPQLLGLMESR